MPNAHARDFFRIRGVDISCRSLVILDGVRNSELVREKHGPEDDNDAASVHVENGRPRDGPNRLALRKRVSRLLAMLILFQSGEQWDGRALAARFGVSKTRIYHDINVLREMGIPIRASTCGYQMAAGYFMPPLSLTLDEAVSLLVPVAFSPDSIPQGRILRNATEKLLACLPPGIRRGARLAQARVRVSDRCGAARPLVVHQLVRRALEQRRVAVAFAPRHGHYGIEGTWCQFDPCGLFRDRGTWYVTGHIPTRDRIQTYRVEDVESVEFSPSHFDVPEDFSIDDYLSNAHSAS
jgi:predicted DNA-binding transcriptional regulator YafY